MVIVLVTWSEVVVDSIRSRAELSTSLRDKGRLPRREWRSDELTQSLNLVQY